MSVSYGFYSALYSNNAYDRIYQSGEMSKLFDGLMIDGVYLSSRENDPTNKQFMVSADTNDMHVKVAPGKAWFLGTYTVSDSDITLTIDAAHSTYDRIDAIVIEVNSKITGYDLGPVYTERFNSIKVIKGTPASTPVKPAWTAQWKPLKALSMPARHILLLRVSHKLTFIEQKTKHIAFSPFIQR